MISMCQKKILRWFINPLNMIIMVQKKIVAVFKPPRYDLNIFFKKQLCGVYNRCNMILILKKNSGSLFPPQQIKFHKK